MIYDINGNSLIRENGKTSFIHISFDDVSYCIKHISSGNLGSIFEDSFFNMLKSYHDEYGAVFSLYPYNLDASGFFSIPSKYKNEFRENARWLKFGYHCYSSENLENGTEQEAISRYNNFVAVINEKMHGINQLDRMPRLQNYKGSLEACRGLIKANSGIIGLLGTSHVRTSYYLDAEQSQYMRENGVFYDTINGLVFLNTSMCLDWFVSGFSSTSEYEVPVYSAPYDELVYRYSMPAKGKCYNNLEVFGHEWQVYNSSYQLNQTYKDYIKQVCKFGADYGFDFDYPMYKLGNITSFPE